MAKFLKYFGLIVVIHLVFLIGYIAMNISLRPQGENSLDGLIILYFLWPMFLLPIGGGGGSHGGELFLSPIAIVLNSLIIAYVVTAIKRIRNS